MKTQIFISRAVRNRQINGMNDIWRLIFKFGNFGKRSSAVRKPHLPGLGKLELPKYLLNPHKSFPAYQVYKSNIFGKMKFIFIISNSRYCNLMGVHPKIICIDKSYRDQEVAPTEENYSQINGNNALSCYLLTYTISKNVYPINIFYAWLEIRHKLTLCATLKRFY